MEFRVYLKSHSEMPDYEAEFSGRDLRERKCLIPFLEDVDGSVVRCGGLLEKIGRDYRCGVCGAVYRCL